MDERSTAVRCNVMQHDAGSDGTVKFLFDVFPHSW